MRWGTMDEQGYPTVTLRHPEPGTPIEPEIDAICVGLAEYAQTLRELGHAYVHLDANARHLIARVALAYLEVHGFTVTGE